MWLWILALLIVLFSILIRKCFQISKLRRTVSKLPGFRIHNFITGHLFMLKKRNAVSFHVVLLEVLTGLATIFRKEGLFHFWVSIEPFVYLLSAETVEPILNSYSNELIEKGPNYKLLDHWLGNGLLTSTGNKWKTRRKLITPTFHYQILDEFIPTFDKNSRIFIQNLKELKDEDWIDITSLVACCTLDIISETAMGVEIKSQDKTGSEYIDALERITDRLMVRLLKPWIHNDFLFHQTSEGKKYLKDVEIHHDLRSKVSKQRKEELKIKGVLSTEIDIYDRKIKEPLLDTLIKHQFQNSNFTDKDIYEEVDTFMFEGHDTTATGVGWTLYFLGLYPEIQQNVYEELLRIFDGDRERPITSEDIKEMKYLECVIKETLRLSPSVPFISRSCNKDINIKGYTIPRGTVINILIYALHRDPKVFPNPEVFDPDRFLPENCIGRHPFAYIPFSAGPRNCIGQKYAMIEMKVLVSRMLLNFELESVDTSDKIQRSLMIMLKPIEGYKLRLKKRE